MGYPALCAIHRNVIHVIDWFWQTLYEQAYTIRKIIQNSTVIYNGDYHLYTVTYNYVVNIKLKLS